MIIIERKKGSYLWIQWRSGWWLITRVYWCCTMAYISPTQTTWIIWATCRTAIHDDVAFLYPEHKKEIFQTQFSNWKKITKQHHYELTCTISCLLFNCSSSEHFRPIQCLPKFNILFSFYSTEEQLDWISDRIYSKHLQRTTKVPSRKYLDYERWNCLLFARLTRWSRGEKQKAKI